MVTLQLKLSNIDDTGTGNYIEWWNNKDNWQYFDTTWTSTGGGITTTKMWYTCPYCNNLVEWGFTYCSHCGNRLIAKQPTNQEVIEKLDKLLKEINELKAKLIK